MLAILEARRAEQTAMGSKTQFVFATSGKSLPDGTRSAPKPFAQWSRCKARLDTRAALAEPWRLHDLRRSMVTHCADKLRIAPHVIEATVNHVSGSKGGVAGIYNRAEHLDERRAALAAWADFVLRIVGDVVDDNVVPMFHGSTRQS
jgi:hypothetical protein